MKRYSIKDISQETILATRKYGAAQCQACIDEAVSGKVRVNDIEAYREHQQGQINKYESGAYDGALHFLQKAIYIQYGTSVPMFSK